MKKNVIAVSLVVALLLLAVRALYLRVGKLKIERSVYAQSLGFHFSASVDSLKNFSDTNGYVYFHVTQGELDLSSEDQGNYKLKFNGSLRFILLVDKKMAFHSRDLDKYQLMDSLVIISDLDKIYIYRHRELAAESEISLALNGI